MMMLIMPALVIMTIKLMIMVTTMTLMTHCSLLPAFAVNTARHKIIHAQTEQNEKHVWHSVGTDSKCCEGTAP